MPIELGMYREGVWGRRGDVPVGKKLEELQRVFRKYLDASIYDLEWDLKGESLRVDMEEDQPPQCMCSCDNGLQTLFVVRNRRNGQSAMVGSECIKKFNNPELNSQLHARRDGRLCRGEQPIDRRTVDGKRGRCPDERCICHTPPCLYCRKYEEECVCARCIKCKWKVHDCICQKCFNDKTGEFKHFKDKCNCPRCPKCAKLKKECRCKRCDKLCFDCKCKRCEDCKILMDEKEPGWMKRCRSCYRKAKNMLNFFQWT